VSISARKEKIISSLAQQKYRIFASRVQGQEMHLLDNESPELRLQNEGVIGALARPPIAGDDRLPNPAPAASNNDHLDALEAQSIYIFREAFARLKKLALLWSLGKDSNVMIWLARKAFFGRVPFPALHVDTGKKFPEMYAFRDRYGTEWGLDLRIEPCPPIDAVDPTLPPAARSAARKTEGLKMALAKYGFDGLIAGIRRDEEATRAKERVFSPRGTEGGWDVRDQPPEFWDQFNASPPPGAHLRIHPILHWTEADIWAYTQRENIPIIPLYLTQNGERYRSLGDSDITFPVASNASTIEEILIELEGTKIPERAGRALVLETEDAFERLRVAGYL
jgi:sulfate adenylyltransferase subunit 2